jgi:lipopolysaccharide transport system ATP-binding protein
MSRPIIEIDSVGKRYRIGALREPYLSLRDTVARKTAHYWNVIRQKEKLQHSQKDFWALRDVSFSVNQGDAIGIIGRNGAGKSTLLKILSQITPPTEGRITCRGRIASLLEVGTGFHPELTGRENIYLNGAILGMTRAEIRRKFDDIVAFAEMEKFLDTPVKRYSSGMYVRLAFAVAAHLEPEILVVDEVLAVGDAQFQKKCLNKMGDAAKGGRTVLFVSHNMPAIRSFCSRCVLLDSGTLIMDSSSAEVISSYLTDSDSTRRHSSWEESNQPGDDTLSLISASVSGADSSLSDEMSMEEEVNLQFDLFIRKPGSRAGLTILLYSQDGTLVLSSLDHIPEHFLNTSSEGLKIRTSTTLPGGLLNEGGYAVSLYMWRNHYQIISRVDSALSFRLQDYGAARGDYYGGWSGVIRPSLEWKCAELPRGCDPSGLAENGKGLND